MAPEVQDVAQGLLSHLHLTSKQAAVLLDDSSLPQTLRVYIFDKKASKRRFNVSSWRGYDVKIVTGAKLELHRSM